MLLYCYNVIIFVKEAMDNAISNNRCLKIGTNRTIAKLCLTEHNICVYYKLSMRVSNSTGL